MKIILVILFSLLLVQPVLAEPGPAIAKMIQTPATAFDMFLFRLYEAAKCNNVLKNNNSDEADLCLSTIKYDADKNVLSAFFRVLPGAEVMDDFVDQEFAGRKEIMLKLLDNTVRRFGAVDTWGLLHNTPISHGWKGSKAEEKSFRTELAQRTSTALTTSYDGVVYIATRKPDGSIEYFTSK
ncbi:MAG: hypothetical protein OER98_05015 [Gammaproteobacteria bacterium]|nr:hypothetical protein [Gammaproteobacteria bacterium]